MIQLGFSSYFVSLLQALYYKESFFVEAGDITTSRIFPRRGLKQGIVVDSINMKHLSNVFCNQDVGLVPYCSRYTSWSWVPVFLLLTVA